MRVFVLVPLLLVSACRSNLDDLAPVATSGQYGDLQGKPDLTAFAERSSLAPVATSGAYADLSGAPALDGFVEASALSTAAFSGSYADLAGLPNLNDFARVGDVSQVGFTGLYADLVEAPDLGLYATRSSLSVAAFSGSYADLSDKPDLSGYATAAALSTVAVTGAYADLLDKPALSTVAGSGSYDDLSDTPDLSVFATNADLAAVATSGNYADLSDTPDLGVYATSASLSDVATSGAYADLSGKPDLGVYATSASLAAVATSGSYADLSGKPELGVYATSASLSSVATSGLYSDLSGRPDLGVFATSASLAPVATSGSYRDLAEAPWSWMGDVVLTDSPVLLASRATSTVREPSVHAVGSSFNATAHWQSFTAERTGEVVRLHIALFGASGTPGGGYSFALYEGEGIGGRQLFSQSDLDLQSGNWDEIRAQVELPSIRIAEGKTYTWALSNDSSFHLSAYPWSTYAGGRNSSNVQDADYAFEVEVLPLVPGVAVDSESRVGVGTTKPTAALDVAADTLRLRGSRSPASDAPCLGGEISWDAGFVYICVAPNHWKKAALADY